jgi:spermidine synthase
MSSDRSAARGVTAAASGAEADASDMAVASSVTGAGGTPVAAGGTPAASGATAVQTGATAPALGQVSPRALYGLVFFAGIGSMATEICASRLLAPFYGSSTIVWANIIGLILLSLSIGYWLGGRLADRHPSPRWLGMIVLAGAALIAVVPFVARPFLNWSVGGLERMAVGTVVGSFFASVVLFVPPVTLLGMVTPYAIRLGIHDVTKAGAMAGRIFALSTAGSLLGTFLPSLVTIPLIGTQRTMLAAAALIALSATFVLGARWLWVGLGLAALLALPPGVVKAETGLVYEAESRYQFIQVIANGVERRLQLNEGYAIHSLYRPDTVLTGGEWDMFLAVPPLLDRPVERVAILGNAGGTTARAFGVYYPQAAIDGVEIDPAVSAAGLRYFGMGENPRLTVHNQDARPFLVSSKDSYDLIFVDAYRQPYVPFYLATREFFRLVRQHLRPGGMIALNVSSVPGDDRLARDVAGTLASEFPQVVTWQALHFNQLVIGLTAPLSPAEMDARLSQPTGAVRLLTDLMAENMKPAVPLAKPWTDDLCPVEWITDRMIVDYAVRGTNTQEQLLPTAP